MFRRDDGTMPPHRDGLMTMGEQGETWDDCAEECIDLPEDVKAEARRLEALIESDREKWARHYDLLAPIPSVFVSQEDE